MAINFPDAPSNGDTHTVGDKTWTYDGTAWNLVTGATADHGNLDGLGDDDHTQYLLADGSRTATELTVTNTLTVDTNTLHVDSTNNRVGIGTTTPAYKLDAKGQVQIGADDNITPDASGNGHLMIDGAGYTGFASLDGTAMWVGHNSGSRNLYLATDETARVTVTGGGNVGIGDTTPSYKLDVNGDINSTGTVRVDGQPLPQRVATGVLGPAAGTSHTATFPSGRFTSAPIVAIAPMWGGATYNNLAIPSIAYASISTTGFTMYAVNAQNGGLWDWTYYRVYWIAIQM